MTETNQPPERLRVTRGYSGALFAWESAVDAEYAGQHPQGGVEYVRADLIRALARTGFYASMPDEAVITVSSLLALVEPTPEPHVGRSE